MINSKHHNSHQNMTSEIEVFRATNEPTIDRNNSIEDFSSIKDSREIYTMPEMDRSTLMDQIDYDLDNYKINESSMYSNSIDQSKHSIPKQEFMRAKEVRDSAADIKPKFMNFLNQSERQSV